ncbi:MAG: hypothetical protein CM15mV42_1340 [uncultured marine virus]|nr:MAG: hypothetical protein CM15mV42_1340 [uncultured marine virus]
MQNILFTLAFLLPVCLSSSQISTCDVELLNFNWDQKEITLTLNDNNCISTPTWVPTNDSVYAIQMFFSFDGYNCNIASNNSNFLPNLGLNDTITYSIAQWSDPFNCVDSAFEHYVETCEAVVGVTGANHTINIDLNGGNNYIGYNPIWDNCYQEVFIEEENNNILYTIYDRQGNLILETYDIPWTEMKGLYIIKQGNVVSKHFF